ncbi:hypothetical protein [Burkholderia multivorans]|uniref:hypothetical protein n=1 Tax=Burkholderia multivorans TaxID=87883 RepID=UPI0011B1E52F|nr:hypothetical protein [Burkholderia multivorans]
MITITKTMLEAMYTNSDNRSVVGSTYDISANSIEMKDEDLDLEVFVFSHYTNETERNEMIGDGETDAEKIFDATTWIDAQYEIVCEHEYVLEEDAKEYLIKLHDDFCDNNKSCDLDHIEYGIEKKEENEEIRRQEREWEKEQY